MKKTVVLLSIILFFTVSHCFAKTPQERAAELKNWQEQCNDPDYDLRLAYIEQAIETNDMSIKRICIRTALESDNGDIKNLGLRAAIAATDRIHFNVELPEKLLEDLKKAEKDEEKLNRLKQGSDYLNYSSLNQGLSFMIEGASVSKGAYEWYPLADNAQPDKIFKGRADIVGSSVKWTGNMLLRNSASSCDLNVKLLPGGILEGFIQIKNSSFPLRVKANLY
jgi:hypothetical protein